MNILLIIVLYFTNKDFKLIYHYISKFYSNFVVSNRINSKRYGTSIDHLQHFR